MSYKIPKIITIFYTILLVAAVTSPTLSLWEDDHPLDTVIEEGPPTMIDLLVLCRPDDKKCSMKATDRRTLAEKKHLEELNAWLARLSAASRREWRERYATTAEEYDMLSNKYHKI